MAKFFFDLDDGETVLPDNVGSELADMTSALGRAADLAAGELSYLTTPARPFDPREFHIRDATGKCVAKVAFRYVFR